MANKKRTKIEANCPTCGTVECWPEEFDLRICSHAPASYYTFTCPGCDAEIRKHADDRVAEILISHGTRPHFWAVPGEVLELHSGAPITNDDILDFMLALEHGDPFAELRLLL